MPVKFHSGLKLLHASVLQLPGPAEVYGHFLFKTSCDHLKLRTDKLQSARNDVESNPVLRHLFYVCLI
jgi:hypothetical protein